MFWKGDNRSWLGSWQGRLLGAALTVFAGISTASAQTTFPANPPSLGAIPDAPAGGGVCGTGNAGVARDVTFTVTGMSGPITDVRVSLTGVHSWVGDLTVTLLAPGGTPSQNTSHNVGSTTATGCGDDSDVGGPYVFFDTAPAAPTFWGAAATAAGAVPVAAGSYRVSTNGGVAGGGANTLITPTFAAATPNGTWTLRIVDSGDGDTGSVTAASLTLTGAVVVTADVPVDFNADGRSDYVVVRNVGGGPSGQTRWFINANTASGSATQAFDWGLASDFFVSEDFDNDNKDDIAVWRSGSATVAAFYILNSATSTARVEAFGQTGDDPTVVDDYNNDGSADLAVYRAGASAGLQSTWFYRTTPGGPVSFNLWGQSGDFPMPGDIDGDGSADFTIQRNAGGGNAVLWTHLSTGAESGTIFGFPTDVLVPGDYDGDGKTDLAIIRPVGGTIHWYYRRSIDGGVVGPILFGLIGDAATPADYDGDGRVDVSVWRNGTFWVQNSSNGATQGFGLGASGDYPVANFNTH